LIAWVGSAVVATLARRLGDILRASGEDVVTAVVVVGVPSPVASGC
jgi:hypothetical protein